jgi:autotransporter translocation and assembly factor TamB
MTGFGSSLFGQAIKAAAFSAALALSMPAGNAQSSSPFAGFDGAWSGTGTVSLSDGTTERIRCKADYKVDGGGLSLKQSLRCASDSYKIDLSSDVTSQGNRISGNWSEASRNLFGDLQGTAGGGQIEVFVEANGFAANLTLRTTGNRQTVQISSKGEIRGVNITMVKS